ncbi:MAG TPA: lyase family protein [Treponemataceae bacterium]|nr:lyase family protein [Treponemataceae bacterium]
MKTRSIYKNISPIDHRYSLSEPRVFDALSLYISEEAAIRYNTIAEIALIKAHLSVRHELTDSVAKKLDTVAQTIDPEAVYAEDEKTQHSIRALVNVIKTMVSKKLAPLVHLGATSVDILDTALSARMRDVVQNVVLPELKKLETQLCYITEREATTPQVGRTHGQHAVPITFGFAMAEYVSRLGISIQHIETLSNTLCGKLAGPVGAYNGTSMLVNDPEELEKRYLEYMNLHASEHSTQLVQPEHLLRVLLECNIAFGIIANLADDLRNLQRSEIGEVFEYFSTTQVGSSTMPQKRNPWNSEHVKSLWKTYCPRVMTFYMDQISEHQRDLSNSASQRFIAEYISGFTMAIVRMRKIVSGLQCDHQNMTRNLLHAGGKVQGGVLAEPAYILLAQTGVTDAHEIIRKMTIDAEHHNITFYEAMQKKPKIFTAIKNQLKKLGESDPEGFFAHPERYRGIAAEKAIQIAKKYKNL